MSIHANKENVVLRERLLKIKNPIYTYTSIDEQLNNDCH